MLATLGNLGAWAAWIGRKVRRLFPPTGPGYELFDYSGLLLVLGLVGYVLSDPPANTAATLQAPLRVFSEMQLGSMMTAAAVFGLVTSYFPRWMRWGYIATISTTGALSLNFLVGFVANGTSVRAVISVVLYGFIARHLLREVARDR